MRDATLTVVDRSNIVLEKKITNKHSLSRKAKQSKAHSHQASMVNMFQQIVSFAVIALATGMAMASPAPMPQEALEMGAHASASPQLQRRCDGGWGGGCGGWGGGCGGWGGGWGGMCGCVPFIAGQFSANGFNQCGRFNNFNALDANFNRASCVTNANVDAVSSNNGCCGTNGGAVCNGFASF